MSDRSVTLTGAALLIIDVQQGLFDKSTPVYRATELLQNLNTLEERARQSGVPIFYVQHANDSFLVEGSQGWQLHPALHPLPTNGVIRKRQASAFQKTALQAELVARNVKRLVVGGLVTHGCVKAACLDACRLGYEVTLVSDGHSSFSPKAAALIEEWHGKLAAAGVALKPTAEIVFGAG